MNDSANPAALPAWELRPALVADIEVIVELRAAVMRADLERLGRYDPHRVRQRFRDSFAPMHTLVVEADGAFAGCVTLRPDGDDLRLEHFYLAPVHQGRGLGSAVLGALLDRADADARAVRLDVLQGSAARRLYERHGFTMESQDPVDVHMIRKPNSGPPAGSL
ncbi:N-acetyltransferase family protein [Streptomyces sp. cg35]|uniref:GNAT family N-acetyltransferase n=1 Tax=Streptomyces sp. cg35 TaxID=3421650 RepID=UPI003D180841